MALTVLDHPLARHLMAGLRDKRTDPHQFRQLADTLSEILFLEATRRIACKMATIETPLESTDAEVLERGLAVVPILRAGLGMLAPALRLFPDVSVGYVGLERSHETAVAARYYCKLPALRDRFSLCCDPMLATGGSASQAITFMKDAGATEVTMVCVVAAPEGVAELQDKHPDVPIVAAALDRALNDQKYILPGLGDFGDRLYGTY